MEATKEYKNFEEFEEAFDNIPEEMIKRETYDLLKLYNQTQQQLQSYKDKEDKLRELFKDYNIEKPASGLSQCTYEITAEDMYKILQILNEGDE